MGRKLLAVFGFILLILAVRVESTFGQAASNLAQLNGTIVDASGGAVAKANVTLRDVDTNRTYTATASDSGFYVIPNLVPGQYELKVTFTGFAPYTQTGVVLRVSQTATIDVTLKVAAAGGENVVVTAEVPVIEPTRTEISQVVGTQQINSLPINGRLFTDFALLTPGVATSRTSLGTSFTDYETTQISFGGMRSYSNMVAVDGADFVNSHTAVQRATPPQESVQEFRVVNNSFGAEYGRAAGGIVNIVTKGGTNDLHGSIYDYLQNSGADARYMLQPAPLPHELRQNQFGGTLGGPIHKDKTFFFVNYEGKRRAESPVYPPDLVNNLDLIDHTKAVLGLAPEGCNTGLSNCTGSNLSYVNGFLKTENDDWGFVRLDHQVGANSHLGIRYNVLDTRGSGELVGQTLDGGGIGTPSAGRNLFLRDQALFGTLDSSLRPNLFNSVLVQWARRHYNFPGASGQPDLGLLNDLEMGHNFGTDDRKYESHIQFSDSLSWTKGNHSWKFGFDGNYIWDVDVFPGFTPVRPLIPAAGAGPIDCLANFAVFYNSQLPVPGTVPADVAAAAAPANCPVSNLHGVVVVYAGVPLPTDPNACSTTACLPVVTAANNPLDTKTWANAYPPSLFSNYRKDINHGYWAGFFQDQWRITRKLTLNYGLRWEYESGLTNWIKRDFRGWQPRVGLAYSPDSKTVIRAGFGIFDDRYNLVFFFVPNTQKVVPGYLCDNHAPSSIAAVCQGAGITPQQLPQTNLGQASQGYQLFVLPPQKTPTGAEIPIPAIVSAAVIATGGYDAFENPPTFANGAPFPNAGKIEMAGTCFTNGACGVGAGGMEHNSPIPYSEQASLEIDRQFGGGFALSLSYLFVGAHNLVRGNNINVPCPVGTTKSAPATNPLPEWSPGLINADGTLSPCTGTPALATGALAGLGPWFGGAVGSGLQTISAGLLDYNNDVAIAIYHGLTVTGQEKFGKHITLNANYTYSHTIDDGNFTTFVNLPVNQFDYRAERANSNQDLRHRFVTNFTADTPAKGWYRNLQFSSIITVETGRPFTIFSGGNTLNDLTGSATDRVGGAPFFSGTTGSNACASVDRCETMIPRNTYFGDSLRTWDLRVSRIFQVTEKGKLQLSVDAFNVLNRANVDEVTPVYGSPVFCGGAIPKRYNDAASAAIHQGTAACPVGIPVPGGSIAPTPLGNNMFIPALPNSGFGLPRTMFNPRQLQVALKFSF